jgi:hypothetical protein
MNTVIREGIWTPWASVLCLNCHGRGEGYTRIVDAAWARKDVDLDAAPEGEGLTVCDTCGITIAVSETVAVEHELVLRLKKLGVNASMAQTGGMCSATEVDLSEDGNDHLLLTDSEETDNCGEQWYVGYYPYAQDENTSGFGLNDGLPNDAVEAFVRDIVTRYNAGERDFGGMEF